jgi:hypothetical protein
LEMGLFVFTIRSASPMVPHHFPIVFSKSEVRVHRYLSSDRPRHHSSEIDGFGSTPTRWSS